MQLTLKVARQNPGHIEPVLDGTTEFDDPLLKAAALDITFRPETGTDRIHYEFIGKATLSFIDEQLNNEHCDIRGSTTLFPNTNTYRGFVSYTNDLQESTPAKGLECKFLGQMQYPGLIFRSFPPHLPYLREVQPTLQQQRNGEVLFEYGYELIETAAFFIIEAEGCPCSAHHSIDPLDLVPQPWLDKDDPFDLELQQWLDMDDPFDFELCMLLSS